MSGSKIVDSVLKVAEKASRIDLEQAGKKACETVKSLNAGTIVNAINVNSAERIERRTMATWLICLPTLTAGSLKSRRRVLKR